MRSDSTTIVYAGAQEVELNAGGTTVRTYWPNGLGVEIDRPNVSASELSWIHADRLGSIVGLSNENGDLRDRLEYDAWGKRRSTIDHANLDNNIEGLKDNKGFTGHEMLEKLDLVHMNGRVYDPLLGKFMSGDPLITDPMNGQRYNRYSYVLNNPTNLVDPTGFCETTTGSNICGGGAGGSKLEIIPGDPYGTEKYWVGNLIESLIETKGQQGSASARTEAAEKGVKGRKISPDDPEAPLTDSDKSVLRDGLAAQQAMAKAMLTSLKRWNDKDREMFSSVFGRADGASRNFIQEVARRELRFFAGGVFYCTGERFANAYREHLLICENSRIYC